MKRQILEHLKNSGHYENVGLGLSLAAVQSEPVIRGRHHLWVLQLSTTPSKPLSDLGPAIQSENVVYGVVITLKAYNDRTGQQTDQALDQLILDVRQDLFDFVPTDLATRYERLSLAGGGLQKFADGSVIYLEKFQTQRTIAPGDVL